MNEERINRLMDARLKGFELALAPDKPSQSFHLIEREVDYEAHSLKNNVVFTRKVEKAVMDDWMERNGGMLLTITKRGISSDGGYGHRVVTLKQAIEFMNDGVIP